MGLIQDKLDEFADETISIIQGNMSSTGTNASGDTSKSLKRESGKESVKVTGKAFIFVVETGRKPGKMPPVNELVKWLESGKASFTGKIESVAWAISKTIAKHGSSLFRKGGREDIITPALDDKRIDQLTSDIADIELGKTVKVIEDGIKN